MKKKLLFAILIILILTNFTAITIPYAWAGDTSGINTEYYNPGLMSPEELTIVGRVGRTFIKTVRTFAIIIGVLVIGILGLKYIFGSVAEKADYKKSILQYLVGVVIVVAILSILPLIAFVVDNKKQTTPSIIDTNEGKTTWHGTLDPGREVETEK